MSKYIFLKSWECADDMCERYYKSGDVVTGERLPTDVLVRQGFLAVYGDDATARKVEHAGEPEQQPVKRKRGRPRKVRT